MAGFNPNKFYHSHPAMNTATNQIQSSGSSAIYATQISSMIPSQETTSNASFEELVDLALTHLNLNDKHDVEVTAETLASAIARFRIAEAPETVREHPPQPPMSSRFQGFVGPHAQAVLPSSSIVIGSRAPPSLQPTSGMGLLSHISQPSPSSTLAKYSPQVIQSQKQTQPSGQIEFQYDPRELEFPVLDCPMCASLWQVIQHWMATWGFSGDWRKSATKEACKGVEEHMMVHKPPRQTSLTKTYNLLLPKDLNQLPDDNSDQHRHNNLKTQPSNNPIQFTTPLTKLQHRTPTNEKPSPRPRLATTPPPNRPTLLSNLAITPTTPIPEILSLATHHLNPVTEDDITTALATINLTPTTNPSNTNFRSDDPTFPVPQCRACDALWGEVAFKREKGEGWGSTSEELGMRVDKHMLDHTITRDVQCAASWKGGVVVEKHGGEEMGCGEQGGGGDVGMGGYESDGLESDGLDNGSLASEHLESEGLEFEMDGQDSEDDDLARILFGEDSE
ncbi:hypothetical protein DM02DRAFT_687633 [Periconia macrospinosa]|uniref:Uncharacterized protein n=1 Tax=Periconia macrospinosa TaxID=97972 RepID=A0A2V1DEF6_9PLEO|nr:hypothetical protein DM02DRAFT_687633 [Periconia macrospinosa]